MSLIRNSTQTKQGIDFTGFQNGQIHPTDIAAVLQFGDRNLILFEMKRKGNKIEDGQRWALENICKYWSKMGKVAFALKIEHSFNDDDVDVPIELCEVTEYYIGNRRGWLKPKHKTVKGFLNAIGEKYQEKKLKFE